MFDVIRLLRAYLVWLIPLSVLAIAAAAAETIALISIVPLAKIVSDGDQTFTGTLGPLDLELSVDELLAIGVAGVVAALVANLSSAYAMARVNAAYLYRERMGLWDRYLAARWERQASEREGRLQTHNGFVASGSRGLLQLTQLTVAMVSLLVMLAAAFAINPISTLIMIALGAVVVGAMIPINRLLKLLGRRTAEASTELGESISEVSTHTLDFRIFGTTGAALGSLRRGTIEVKDLQKRSMTIQGLVTPAYRSLGLFVVLALLFIGSRQSDLNVAGFGAIALLLLRGLSYGQRVQGGIGDIVGAVGPLEQLEESRQTFEAARESFGDTALTPIQTLQLDDLGYTYDDGDSPAIHKINLIIPHGEVIGLAGPSGSGKSTLSQVLVRLRAPTEGRHLINGVDAQSYTVESWTRQVAFVPQAPALFHGTIRDNITVYRSHLDDDDVERAAREAGIHETVEALPHGYDTEVGTSERNLSGGQVQRLGIARALAGRPSLLVLDEPTSALDVVTEGLIQETLERIRDEMTIVIIAHRLSTLSICDRVVPTTREEHGCGYS
jgi:ABC-type multidrug transport system fused ATPase/permease subunit